MTGSSRLPAGGAAGNKLVIPHAEQPAAEQDSRKQVEENRRLIDSEPDWNRRILLHGIQAVPMSMPPDYSILHSPEEKADKKKKRKATAIQILSRYWDNRAELRQFGREANWLYQKINKTESKTLIQIPPDIQLSGKYRSLKSTENWSGIVESWLSMSVTERAENLEKRLKHIKLANDDEREGLRGQSGVNAARNIEAFTVLGPYVGKYCFGKDLQEEQGTHGANVGRYTVDCSQETMRLDLCGYGYGNITVCINANTTYRPADPVRTANAFFVMVVYQGWPYVFVVSKNAIRKGEEVLVDYGRYYWLGY